MIPLVLFYIVSALILIAAFMMVFSTNLVHSALFMAAAFIGIAFVYLLLEAEYLAVVQILVYVGAISVLFVFGVMLTRRDSMEKSNMFNRYGIIAGLMAAALGLVLGRTLLLTSFNTVAVSSQISAVSAISTLLLGDYVIPFEAAGILLLIAMIGAIVIGKGVNQKK